MEKDTNKALIIAGFSLVVLLILSIICFYCWGEMLEEVGVKNNAYFHYEYLFNLKRCAGVLVISFVNILIYLLVRFVGAVKKEISEPVKVFKYTEGR